jgi:hypothetical protein
MLRSSVAAFYARFASTFYRLTGSGWGNSFSLFCGLLRINSEVEKIVHWMPEILFAAQIAFRGLNRCVTEQELNLFNLSTSVVAQFRTSSPQIMRGNVL